MCLSSRDRNQGSFLNTETMNASIKASVCEPSTSKQKPDLTEKKSKKKKYRPDEEDDETATPLYVSPLILKTSLPNSDDLRRVTDRFVRGLQLTDPGVTGKFFTYFSIRDVKDLLRGRMVVFIGDSVVRGMYKDLLHVCQAESLTHPFDLQNKAELRFEGDMLVKGNKLYNKPNGNGTDFEEMRMAFPQSGDFSAALSFTFVTKMWNRNIDNILENEYFHSSIKYGFPDFVFVNSCLWDLVRYAKFKDIDEFKKAYEQDVRIFIKDFLRVSQGKSCLIFLSTLPLGKHCSGAFLSEKQEKNVSHGSIWRYIRPANDVVKGIVREKRRENKPVGYLDLHSLACNLGIGGWRENDGTHWKPQAHRLFTFSILSMISEILGKNLPTRDFEPYYQACDDIARFDIYLRWLTTDYLRRTNAKMSEVMDAWTAWKSGTVKILPGSERRVTFSHEPVDEMSVGDEAATMPWMMDTEEVKAWPSINQQQPSLDSPLIKTTKISIGNSDSKEIFQFSTPFSSVDRVGNSLSLQSGSSSTVKPISHSRPEKRPASSRSPRPEKAVKRRPEYSSQKRDQISTSSFSSSRQIGEREDFKSFSSREKKLERSEFPPSKPRPLLSPPSKPTGDWQFSRPISNRGNFDNSKTSLSSFHRDPAETNHLMKEALLTHSNLNEDTLEQEDQILRKVTESQTTSNFSNPSFSEFSQTRPENSASFYGFRKFSAQNTTSFSETFHGNPQFQFQSVAPPVRPVNEYGLQDPYRFQSSFEATYNNNSLEQYEVSNQSSNQQSVNGFGATTQFSEYRTDHCSSVDFGQGKKIPLLPLPNLGSFPVKQTDKFGADLPGGPRPPLLGSFPDLPASPVNFSNGHDSLHRKEDRFLNNFRGAGLSGSGWDEDGPFSD